MSTCLKVFKFNIGKYIAISFYYIGNRLQNHSDLQLPVNICRLRQVSRPKFKKYKSNPLIEILSTYV